MKKLITCIVAATLVVGALTGCSSDGGNAENGATTPPANTEGEGGQQEEEPEAAGFDTSQEIAVVSREDGSGTRGAFIELFGIEEKDADGNKVDMTTQEAEITNSTSVMMTNIAGNPYAIGYISLGSLNGTVKALKIDGTNPSVETIKDGSYKISRPFNIAVNGTLSDVAQDFYNYIMSAEGQAVVEESGYIAAVDTAEAFSSNGASGKIVIAGSSSVTPVMEKLKEAYVAINSGADIEIQQSDSTTGMNAAIDGICDIGMASRELKDSELEKGLTPTVIAIDGIAVIVNQENTLEDLPAETVKGIYTGEILTWADAA